MKSAALILLLGVFVCGVVSDPVANDDTPQTAEAEYYPGPVSWPFCTKPCRITVVGMERKLVKLVSLRRSSGSAAYHKAQLWSSLVLSQPLQLDFMLDSSACLGSSKDG
jgi:hypothetical protein